MTANLAVAGVDAAAVAVLSEPHGIFALKEAENSGEGFSQWNECSGVAQDSTWQELC